MPAVPPELREWLTTLLQPAVILAGVGLIMKRIDDLRDSVNKRIDDLRADNQRLDGKVDRLVEALAAKALTPITLTTSRFPRIKTLTPESMSFTMLTATRPTAGGGGSGDRIATGCSAVYCPLVSALLKAAFPLGISSLFLFQGALGQWVVETSNDGDKTAYSEDTPSRNDENISAYLAIYPHDEGGCDTEIHVFHGDDHDDVVEFQRKNWFKYRFDTEIDGKKVIISGEPYEDGGALIYNGSAGRQASDIAFKGIMKRERARTIKLLSESNEFKITLPLLKEGNEVFEISLEDADDAVKEVCL